MNSLRFQDWFPSLVRWSLVGSSAVLVLLFAAGSTDAHGNDHGSVSMPNTKASLEAEITICRSASCACCIEWGAHIAAAGFRIDDHVTEDMDTVKEQRGIALDRASCHTAVVEGYVIEGHVPSSAIQRLLTERPDIRGFAVPGMPVGSPGMDIAGVEVDSFDLMAIDHDGTTSVFESF